jgi:hypothetical protein
VVEPLKKAVDDLVTATELIDSGEPVTPERQLAGMTGLYKQLVGVLPADRADPAQEALSG